ncbi:MAG TPA: coenzyme F420-0:L-glutamate ligase, partial [Trebonia sp.]
MSTTQPGRDAPDNPGPPDHLAAPHADIYGITGIPEISPGDDLAALIADAVTASGLDLRDDDILVVTSKVVSKTEGLVVRSSREDAIAAETVRVVARR